MSTDNSINVRVGAIIALHKILKLGLTSKTAISEAAKKYSLGSRSHKFLARIVFGAVKNISYLDYILLRLLSSRKFPSDICTSALRVGAYQIAFANVPHYAAVDSTIEALRTLKAHRKELSLTNAVLRKFSQRWRSIELPQDPIRHLEIKYSHPHWIVIRWVERYGIDIAERMLVANNADPPKFFRINSLRTEPNEFKVQLRKKSYRIADTPFEEYFEMLNSIPASESELVSEGFISVQDPAFAIPVRIISPQKCERILEIGAAPGGKNTHIAEILRGDTSNLFALDLNLCRIALIGENFLRLGISCPNIVAGDGTILPFTARCFDKVLIDAPCTALGVIRRHPEIRWHRKPGDIKTLAKLQQTLIAQAHKSLKTGGIMVFSTCTTEPEENQGAIQTMTKLGLRISSISNIPRRFIEAEGKIARTLPHRDKLDGSFSVMGVKL